MSSEPLYARAGVNLGAATRSLELVREAVAATHDERVLAGLGAFGGVFDLSFLDAYAAPVLVVSTDGVGTKTLVAAAMNDYRSLGRDLVHHCVNDILVQGATPLLFMDYLAAAELPPERSAEVIASVAHACRETGMALLGGETAEMPGVYRPGALDLAGTAVGVCERERLVTGAAVRAGDLVYALASSGLHTNGYSLARPVLEGCYDEPFGDATLGAALLTPHRSYLTTVRALLAAVPVRGMAHVTGGGIPGNLPRILGPGLGAVVEFGTWPVPELFGLIQRRGGVSDAEMLEVFNLGAGFLLVVAPEEAAALEKAAPEPLYRIGEIVAGAGVRVVRP